MKSRSKTISTTIAVVLIFIILFRSYGYNNTWKLWNLPTLSFPFADMRVITSGAESCAQGFDPLINNPADPMQRRLNYPRIWQGLYLFGINSTHTTYLALAVIFLFLLGICLILPSPTNATLAWVFGAVLSPASLLTVERANIDLCVFFLASLSVIAAQRFYLLSSVIVLCGFFLKLFPIFGSALFVKAGRAACFRQMLLIVTVAGVYTLVAFQDLLLINQATTKATILSYGINVVWMKLAVINATIGVYAKVISYLLAFLILFSTLVAAFRKEPPPDAETNSIYLDAFRVGSAIYIATFLLGNNWDYRLIFLILTIPQVIIWAENSLTAKVTIASIFISLWYMALAKGLNLLPYGGYISFTLDELSNWIAFASLLFLFLWSLPMWLKELVRKFTLLPTPAPAKSPVRSQRLKTKPFPKRR